MTAYIVAHLNVNDPERYGLYVADFMPILQRHGGRVVLVDEYQTILQHRLAAATTHFVLLAESPPELEEWLESQSSSS